MIYWAPIINTRILGPDHQDTLEAIDYSKNPIDRQRAWIHLSKVIRRREAALSIYLPSANPECRQTCQQLLSLNAPDEQL
jgi:hypothetical protein